MEMDSFIPHNQPPQARAEASEGLEFVVGHLACQTRTEVAEVPVFGVRHPGSLAGAEVAEGSVFQRPPLRAPNTSSKSAAAVVGSAANLVNNKKTSTLVGISDEDDGGEEEPEVEAIAPKRRKFISRVWEQFEKVEIRGKWKARCVHCSKKLSGETKNGTTHLYNHLRSCFYAKIRGAPL